MRQSLPCLYSNLPHIVDIYEDEAISIVAADRPDKAVVIGPGGYIAGHLTKLHQKPLTITAYTDEVVRNFRKEESRKLLRTIKANRKQKIILEALEELLDGKPQKRRT